MKKSSLELLHKNLLAYPGQPWRRYIYESPIHELDDRGFWALLEECWLHAKSGVTFSFSRLLHSMSYLYEAEYQYVLMALQERIGKMDKLELLRPSWLSAPLIRSWISSIQKELDSPHKQNKISIHDLDGFAEAINQTKLYSSSDFETWARKLSEIVDGYTARALLIKIKKARVQPSRKKRNM